MSKPSEDTAVPACPSAVFLEKLKTKQPVVKAEIHRIRNLDEENPLLCILEPHVVTAMRGWPRGRLCPAGWEYLAASLASSRTPFQASQDQRLISSLYR